MSYLIIGIMLIIILALCYKIFLLKKAVKEITAGFSEKVGNDTNTLIDVSSKDKDVIALASGINTQLRILRREHLQYHQGNAELKNAITNISHDLRTPLTAICGYIDMLPRTEDKEKQAHYISIIKDRTDMMKQLTEELFRYSIILSDEEEPECENVFVNQLLAESISSFYPALTEKNIEPNISITDKRIERKLNKAALARVFSNLLNNAVKYSDGDLDITLTDTGEIIFANTAKELSAVDVGKLFNRFYTVEAAHNSTGLGLSIAKTFIERMGGSITAAYENGRLIIKIVLFSESA